jgi:hypothetical protein
MAIPSWCGSTALQQNYHDSCAEHQRFPTPDAERGMRNPLMQGISSKVCLPFLPIRATL